MNATTEIDPGTNKLLRLFDQNRRENLYLVLVGICVIVTAGTWYTMNSLVKDMAYINSGYETSISNMIESNADLKKEARMLQLEIDDFRIALITAGIEIPQHGGKP